MIWKMRQPQVASGKPSEPDLSRRGSLHRVTPSHGGVPDQNLKAKSKAWEVCVRDYKRVRIRALAGLRLPFAGDNLAIGVLMDIEK